MRTQLLRWSILLLLFSAGCGGSSSENTANNTDTLNRPEITPPPDPNTNTGSTGTNSAATGTDTTDPQTEQNQTEQTAIAPNILLIISDDQGIDASAQYNASDDAPITPVLNDLASKGLVFDNAWATPACTTTRAALMTGQHGINSGVDRVPDYLDPSAQNLHKLLQTTDTYAERTAVFGKWHLAGGNANDSNHPTNAGVNNYAGNLAGTLDDYSNWPLTEFGEITTSTEYHTTAITDLAINWLANQRENESWFLWLAYVAPHSPFHLPPAHLHNREQPLSGDSTDINDNKRQYYLAAIEAMDTEIGRLLNSLSDHMRDNTLVIFIADNGTPAAVIDTRVYSRQQSKNSLYEGGVRVPMLVSGHGVSRTGEREDALINSVDIFATITQLAQVSAAEPTDGFNFLATLTSADTTVRNYNYTEFNSSTVTGWAVRDKQYKLIEYADGRRELYNLTQDPFEDNDLINEQDTQLTARVATLANYAANVRNEQTDAGEDTNIITNTGENQSLDITNAILTNRSASCRDYAGTLTSAVTDINNNSTHQGNLTIGVNNDECQFNTNAIPNHNFNDGNASFPNDVSTQNDEYTITANPQFAATTTPLALTLDNALFLNGVKLDLLAAACFNVGNEKVGCNDMSQPWRFDPMHRDNGFRVDSHNAHTQPDGTYHYHGSPNALFADNSSQQSPLIGFAADGYPIFGKFINDAGGVRAVTPSYRLKVGNRPDGEGNPGGSYDGSFRDDYEYVPGMGDLDECNGATIDGSYGYYVTDGFPYVLGCLKGTPHSSFSKRN